MAEAGSIDHLVHTVGARIGSPPLAEIDRALVGLAFEAKLFSAIEMTRAALPYLTPEASITFTSGQVLKEIRNGKRRQGRRQCGHGRCGPTSCQRAGAAPSERDQPGHRRHQSVG